jgi:hypothetical protein
MEIVVVSATDTWIPSLSGTFGATSDYRKTSVDSKPFPDKKCGGHPHEPPDQGPEADQAGGRLVKDQRDQRQDGQPSSPEKGSSQHDEVPPIVRFH